MAGRFPLYTDEDVDGNLVRALRRAGWDLARALDHHPPRTHDHVHFEHAARLNRVMVSNDSDMLKEWAPKWTAQGKPFRGLVWWPRVVYRSMSTTDLVNAFEALAAEDDPFGVSKVRIIEAPAKPSPAAPVPPPQQ